MAIREIRMFDDQFLHKISKPVDKVDDHIKEILKLLNPKENNLLLRAA